MLKLTESVNHLSTLASEILGYKVTLVKTYFYPLGTIKDSLDMYDPFINKRPCWKKMKRRKRKRHANQKK